MQKEISIIYDACSKNFIHARIQQMKMLYISGKHKIRSISNWLYLSDTSSQNMLLHALNIYKRESDTSVQQ